MAVLFRSSQIRVRLNPGNYSHPVTVPNEHSRFIVYMERDPNWLPGTVCQIWIDWEGYPPGAGGGMTVGGDVWLDKDGQPALEEFFDVPRPSDSVNATVRIEVFQPIKTVVRIEGI
jgi:hypothetical protein